MALSLTYTSESPVDDYFVSVFTDATTYGTGGDPVRADGAVFLTAQKIKSDTTVESSVVITAYDEETVTSWSLTIEKDGWYKLRMVYIPDYDNGATYNQYDAVYSSGTVYRAIQDGFSGQAPTNTSYWEVISDPTGLVDNDGSATESANILSLLYNVIIYPFSKTIFGTETALSAKDCCSTCERSEEVQTYEYYGNLVDALNVANARSAWVEGEKLARKATENC